MQRMPLLFALLAIAMTPAAIAESASESTIYRWLDAQGQLHFGNPEQPPPGAEPVAVEAGTVIQPPPKLPPTNKGTRHRRRGVDRQAAQRAKEQQRRQKQCEDYQEKLAGVRSRMRAGYKASQYNKLMEQQRRYKKKVLELC